MLSVPSTSALTFGRPGMGKMLAADPLVVFKGPYSIWVCPTLRRRPALCAREAASANHSNLQLRPSLPGEIPCPRRDMRQTRKKVKTSVCDVGGEKGQ